MVARVVTVAFEGVEARRVDVEVQLVPGQVAFVIVGLGDKAVAESRERVWAAFSGLGLALPGKRIVVNLAPANLPKEGRPAIRTAVSRRHRASVSPLAALRNLAMVVRGCACRFAPA